MAITAFDSGGGKDFKKVPQGCHFAICNMVVDLGVHHVTFQGQSKRQHKIYIRWEVPDERVTYEKDGKSIEGPCSIGATYTLSLSEKAKLRPLLENWRGKLFTPEELRGFDITTIAGKPCQIVVQHESGKDGKVYAKVTGVMSCSREQRERARAAKSEVGVIVYSLEEPTTNYDVLPNWLKEKLQDRVMPQSVKTAQDVPVDDPFNDDVPF